MNDFSIFEYLYRDAGNYKTWCSVLPAGRAAPSTRRSSKQVLTVASSSSRNRSACLRPIGRQTAPCTCRPRMTMSGMSSRNCDRRRATTSSASRGERSLSSSHGSARCSAGISGYRHTGEIYPVAAGIVLFEEPSINAGYLTTELRASLAQNFLDRNGSWKDMAFLR